MLCTTWPLDGTSMYRATWIHRMEPRQSLPGGATPYRMLFGRDQLTPLDELALTPNGSAFGQGSVRTVAEERQIACTAHKGPRS